MIRFNGCLPFTLNYRTEFLLGCKWYTSFWSVPLENSRDKRKSEKVVPFSRLERSEWKFVYHLQVSWVSYHFQASWLLAEHNRFNSSNKYGGFTADGGFYQCFVWQILACSRPSNSEEDAKVKGTRKVGGAGKRKKQIRAQTSSVTSAWIHHGKWYVSMVGFWPSTIASTATTNMTDSQQMGDFTSVHAAVIPLQFLKYS